MQYLTATAISADGTDFKQTAVAKDGDKSTIKISKYKGKTLKFTATNGLDKAITKTYKIKDDSTISGYTDARTEGCSGCEGQCGKNCANECAGTCGSTCKGGCKNGCKATCLGQCTSCGNQCSSGCTESCTGNCVGGCNDTCRGTCYKTCTGYCYGSCVNGCRSQEDW